MAPQKPIGILGGTFDPVHYGHLRLALEVYQQLHLQEVRFIPCHSPVLDKKAQATPKQRLSMLQQAITGQAGFRIDERELVRSTPSYTVDTLHSLREELGSQPLCLILGQDAFSSLPRWHRWQELIQLAHFIVVERPGFKQQADPLVTQLLQKHQVSDPLQLSANAYGCILLTAITPLAISATAIRQHIALGRSPRYLLPEKILEYIEHEKLYL